MIPMWHRSGVSKQITVRLPDDIVASDDSLIAAGTAFSRAVVVNRVLDRERRQVVAARDAAILQAAGDDPDMQRLVEYAAGSPLDIK